MRAGVAEGWCLGSPGGGARGGIRRLLDGFALRRGRDAGGFNAVSTIVFGHVESLVRLVDEVPGGDAAMGHDGGASDGDGDDAVRTLTVRQIPVPDGLTNFFGDSACASFVGGRQDDGKLFAAVACDEVGGAKDDIEGGFRNLFEATVPADVAVGVVISLEVVDVDHEQGEHVAHAETATPFCGKHFVEAAAICDAGEGIDDDEGFHGAVGSLERLLSALALTDVANEIEKSEGNLGDWVAIDAEIGLNPYVLFVLFAEAVFKGSAGGARVHGAQGHFDLGEVDGMDELLEESVFEVVGRPSGEGIYAW